MQGYQRFFDCWMNARHFGSLFLIAMGLLCIFTGFGNESDYEHGQTVFADVIEKPADCESINSRSSCIKVSYANHTYILNIGHGYCEKLAQDTVAIRISPDHETAFFTQKGRYLEENTNVGFLIILVGIICLFRTGKSYS